MKLLLLLLLALPLFGFGQNGRYAEKPAYDPVVQGSAGVAGLIARAQGEPRYLPYVLADRTGGLIAVQMIAMALFNRERTGEGQAIEVPMFENMATQVMTEHLYNRTYVAAPGEPEGETGDPRLVSPHYTPQKTSDGYFSLSANTNSQVFPLFDAIGQPELKTDPRFSTVAARFANTAEYFSMRSEGMKQHSTAWWLEYCDRHDIPAAPYHTLESLIDDPQRFDIVALKRKSITVSWELMFTRSLYRTPDLIEQHRLLTEVAALVDAGVLRTTLNGEHGRIDAAHLRALHALLESGRAIGKHVLAGF